MEEIFVTSYEDVRSISGTGVGLNDSKTITTRTSKPGITKSSGPLDRVLNCRSFNRQYVLVFPEMRQSNGQHEILQKAVTSDDSKVKCLRSQHSTYF